MSIKVHADFPQCLVLPTHKRPYNNARYSERSRPAPRLRRDLHFLFSRLYFLCQVSLRSWIKGTYGRPWEFHGRERDEDDGWVSQESLLFWFGCNIQLNIVTSETNTWLLKMEKRLAKLAVILKSVEVWAPGFSTREVLTGARSGARFSPVCRVSHLTCHVQINQYGDEISVKRMWEILPMRLDFRMWYQTTTRKNLIFICEPVVY